MGFALLGLHAVCRTLRQRMQWRGERSTRSRARANLTKRFTMPESSASVQSTPAGQPAQPETPSVLDKILDEHEEPDADQATPKRIRRLRLTINSSTRSSRRPKPRSLVATRACS